MLDEINLASPETLQCLSSLLESSQGSFVVTERGSVLILYVHVFVHMRTLNCIIQYVDVAYYVNFYSINLDSRKMNY